MKKKKFNWLTPVLAGAAAVMLLTGCENEKETTMESYRNAGIEYLNKEQYEDAADAFQKALDESTGKIGKKELDLCFYKAEAQYLSGDTDAAMDTYNSIISYDNDSADAYYLRGSLYYAMGDAEKAVNDYSMAVKLDSDNYDLYIGIYNSMTANDQESDGEYYLNEALKIKGDKAKDKLEKGRIYLLLGDNDKAESCLKEALDGGKTEANFYLAQVCNAKGDSDSANSYMQAYLDSGEVTSSDLYEIGVQQMEQKDYAQAITYFTAGLSMDEVPDKQALMKKCIAAYELSGDFTSAKNMMADYVEEYPDDESAARENTFLQTR